MTREEFKLMLDQHDLFPCDNTLEESMETLDSHLQEIPEEYRPAAFIACMEVYNTAIKLIADAKLNKE